MSPLAPSTLTPLPPDRSAERRGFALVLVGAFAVSFKSILVKMAYGHGVGPHALLVLRMGFALAALVVWVAVREGPAGFVVPRREIPRLLAVAGPGMTGAMLLNFESIALVGASLATLVGFTYPVWTVLLAAGLERRPVERRTAVALVLTLVGLLGVLPLPSAEAGAPGAGWSPGTALGLALGLASALCFAGYNVAVERIVRAMSPARLLVPLTLFTGLAMVPGALREGLPPPGPVWGLAAALGLASGVVPFLALLHATRLIGAGRTAVVTTVSPAFTVAWAALLLGERLAAGQVLGMALLVGGVAALRLPVPASRRRVGPWPRPRGVRRAGRVPLG